jgi:hypothetical protein
VGKKISKIDTIGDAYIMVAWLNEGLDQCEPNLKHAPSSLRPHTLVASSLRPPTLVAWTNVNLT